MLPIGSSGPITFSVTAVQSFAWAHCTFMKMLPISSDEPIIFVETSADDAWAHCIFMEVLSISLHRLVVFAEMLPMTSFGPITFSESF